MNIIDFNAKHGLYHFSFTQLICALIIAISVTVPSVWAPKTAFAVDLNRTVYCSKTGKKYHFVIDCSGMKNPISMTLGEAQAEGRTPCSKRVLYSKAAMQHG